MTDEAPQTGQPEPAPERLSVGVIVGVHGVQGQLKMQIWTHFPERLSDIHEIYLGDEDQPRRLVRAALSGAIALLKVEGVDTRNAAEDLRGAVVRIPASEAAPLEEGEYYHYQLLGLPVYSESGEHLGEIADILETGANDVYVVRNAEGRETLLPALESVILNIDLDQRRVTVRPLTYLEE